MDRKSHWDGVYAQKAEDAVSWFQGSPGLSLSLIAYAGLAEADPIIDVGGGTSRLVDRLLAAGHQDVTVLDIAAAALQKSRERLGPKAERVRWLAADITRWRPTRRHALWHDRAVFHFLTQPVDRLAYRRALAAGLAAGGTLIIASFALDGPERCSSLPVQRYSPESLAAELGPGFRLLDSRAEDHLTPAGKSQRFQYSVFRSVTDPR
jgi:SAM-dependent methyltransferase